MSGEQGVALVWDGDIAYDFGPQHPLAPVRVELTVELIRALGLVDGRYATEVPSGRFDEAELLRLHRPDYVAAVKRLSADPRGDAGWEYGLGPGDNPIFAGMHEASMQVCAASKEAARLVWEGSADHAFNPAGGLHHAMPERASGFCIYDDPAVAIDWLLEHGAQRIAYLDVDVHHGDGVQAMFWEDPRVLTVSLHESGRFLFPGTGFLDEIGGRGAEGSAVNLPLLPGTTGAFWLRAFDEAVAPLVHAFSPDVIVSQLGCDTHATDPLAHLALTLDDYREMARRIHALAHDAASGRWVATGGGGYQRVQVVPRAWTLWFAEMAAAPAPVETPVPWQETARRRTGERAPRDFSDDHVRLDEPLTGRVAAATEEAIAATRALVFPHHGLA